MGCRMIKMKKSVRSYSDLMLPPYEKMVVGQMRQ